MAGNSDKVRDYHTFPTDELPEGWCRSTLGDLSELVSGAGFPIKYQGRTGLCYPFFKVGNLGDVNSGELLTETPDTIDNVIINELHAKIIPKNSIVFAKIGMAIRLNRRRMAGVPCCIDNNMMAAVPNGAVLPQYLLRFLETVDFMPLTQATTVPSIRKGDFEALSIPLPPIAEQKRIMTKVEQLLARVNATKERLAKASIILKRFRQAVLAAACSGRLTTDWREKHPEIEAAYRSIQKLKERNNVSKRRRNVPTSVNLSQELSEYQLPTTWMLESTAALLLQGALIDVKDGNHGSNHPKRGEFCNEGCPFITAAQVKNYRIDYEGAPKVTGEPLKRLRVGFAEIGDAILTHKGSVGRAALNTQPCVLTPQTTYYRCNREVLDPCYLVYFLTSPHFFQQLAGVMSQTTRDFVPISEQYHLFIFLPPLTEQQEIIRRVDAMFKWADVAEKRVGITTSRTEKLTQAILARAFRGELVPTEAELARRESRPYETASDLLTRIKSERESKRSPQEIRRNRN